MYNSRSELPSFLFYSRFFLGMMQTSGERSNRSQRWRLDFLAHSSSPLYSSCIECMLSGLVTLARSGLVERQKWNVEVDDMDKMRVDHENFSSVCLFVSLTQKRPSLWTWVASRRIGVVRYSPISRTPRLCFRVENRVDFVADYENVVDSSAFFKSAKKRVDFLWYWSSPPLTWPTRSTVLNFPVIRSPSRSHSGFHEEVWDSHWLQIQCQKTDDFLK